ncbi:MAG: hypothetical protein KDA38_16355 [Planctomycetales bacterium]|nr:hypothetical protein [Planctomycetales bacterium]
MKATNLRWMRCKASNGQFENEVAVSGTEHDGEPFSMFADRKFVESSCLLSDEEQVEALLQVEEIAREGQLVMVRLPGQTLANGHTITVDADSFASPVCHEV